MLHRFPVFVWIAIILSWLCVTAQLQAVGPFGACDYETTWLGNSYPGKDHGSGQSYIQGRIDGMCVDTDGTLFATCRWDENGRNVGIYNANGEPIGMGENMFGRAGFDVGVSNTHIYALGRNGTGPYGIWRLTKSGANVSFTQLRYELPGMCEGHGAGGLYQHTRGLAVDRVRNRLYASNHHENVVHVYHLDMGHIADLPIPGGYKLDVDSDGHLWVIQPSLGRVGHYNGMSGAYLGQAITNLIDPSVVKVHANGQIWVFDSAPGRHRFLIMDASGGDAASPVDTFGVEGGVWARTMVAVHGFDSKPGEVHPLKFNYVSGFGFDDQGNIYVGGQGPPIEYLNEGLGVWIRKFDSNRNHIWSKYGLEFLDVSDADDQSDAIDLYTKHEHFVMDWSQPPGQQWTYRGFTLDHFTYPTDWRARAGWTQFDSLDPADWDIRMAGQFDAVIRNLSDSNGQFHRFMYVHDQHASGYRIYRFTQDSEIAIPCATINPLYMLTAMVNPEPQNPPCDDIAVADVRWFNWRDENGDGLGDGKPDEYDASEVELAQRRYEVWGWHVDSNGHIWTCDADGRISQYLFKGINSIGAPIYPVLPDRTWFAPLEFYPDHSNETSKVYMRRILYVPETDTLYLGGYPQAYPKTDDHWGFLGKAMLRYDNWSDGNPTVRWSIDPSDGVIYDPQQYRNTVPKSMEVVGDCFFYVYERNYYYDSEDGGGRIEVYNHLTQEHLGSLIGSCPSPGLHHTGGPETPHGFNVFMRNNGEYQVYLTDEARAKVLVFRLKDWPKPALPSAPSGLAAVTYRDRQVNLTWDDHSSDEHGFIIESSIDSGNTFEFLHGAGENNTSKVVRNLEPATTYWFRICATNAGGKSPYSNVVAVTTGQPLEKITGTPFGLGMPYSGDPDAGDGYKAAFDGDLSTYVNLIDDWANGGYAGIDAGTPAQLWRIWFVSREKHEYRLVPSVAEPGGKFQGSNTDPHAADYVDLFTITRDNLIPVNGGYLVELDTPVSYRYLRYLSPDGGMCNIAEIEFYTESTVVTPPSAPENLAVTMVSDTSLELTWTDTSNNETGFRIERTTDAFSTTVGANEESYTGTGLTPSTLYTYRVVAYNSLFETACVSPTEASGTTDSPWPPASPTNLTALPDDGRVYLSWTHSVDPDVLYYKVFRSMVQGSGHQCVAVAFGGDSIIDSQVVNETTYYYYLTAVDRYGLESTPTDEVSATPHVLDPPDAPSNLQAVAMAYNQIDLTWTDNADNESGFRLERYNTQTSSYDAIQVVAADLESISDTGLMAEMLYIYRLIAYNTDGDSPPSNEASETTPVAPQPVAPSNLVATVGEGNWITLTWQDLSDNEAGFRIERRTTDVYEEIADVTENTTVYTDVGLDWDTTFTYRVLAYNAGGDSGYSNEASDTTPPVSGPVQVDDADPAVIYSGSWTAQSGWSGRINQTLHESNENGAYAEFSFTGTAVRLIADMQPWGGTADVEIDGVYNTSISYQSVDPMFQQEVYSITGLSDDSHTIRLTKTGGDWIYIDAFEYEGGG